nr:MAG TPA: hypothetical protein [Caudoviricetes sp.]
MKNNVYVCQCCQSHATIYIGIWYIYVFTRACVYTNKI